MKIPSRLKIGAHTFEVRVEDNWPGKGDTVGLCDREKNIIHVDSKLSQSYQWSTLFHEIFHAINSEIDHAILDSLAEQLNQVFCDNQLISSIQAPEQSAQNIYVGECVGCGIGFCFIKNQVIYEKDGKKLCGKCAASSED